MEIELFDAQGNYITRIAGCVNPQQEFDEYYKKIYRAATWKEYLAPQPIPESLLDIQNRKWEEIKSIRDKLEIEPLSYMGKLFDFDDVSSKRLEWAISTAQTAVLTNQTFIVVWTCYDNTTLTMTEQDILGIPLAVAQRSDSLHQIARELREQIYAATTIVDVDAIVWPT
jgi:hypothetical protein